jgi:hypothetical protein
MKNTFKMSVRKHGKKRSLAQLDVDRKILEFILNKLGRRGGGGDWPQLAGTSQRFLDSCEERYEPSDSMTGGEFE